MTKEEEFEAVLDLFTMPGWKLVLEDLDNIRKTYDTISNIDSLLEVGRRQGAAEQLSFFANLEDWYLNGLEAYRAGNETSV